MYEYLINEKTVIFKNEPDMLAGLKAAEEAGYSIELVRDDSMSKKADDTSTFGKPSKEDTFMFGGPTPEEQLRATQLEASGGVAGTSEAPQEDFIQDPAESADAVSETPAQSEAELLLETSSSVSRDKELKQPEITQPIVPLTIKVSEKELKATREIEKLNNIKIEQENEKYNFGVKMGVINPKTKKEDTVSLNNIKYFRDLVNRNIDNGALDKLDSSGYSLEKKINSRELTKKLRALVKDQYNTYIQTQTPGSLKPAEGAALPNEYAIDYVVDEVMEERKNKLINEEAEAALQIGSVIKNDPNIVSSPVMKTEIARRIQTRNSAEQKVSNLTMKIEKLKLDIASGVVGVAGPAQEELDKLLITYAEEFKNMSEADQKKNAGLRTLLKVFGVPEYFLPGSSDSDNNYSQLFNKDTGARISKVEALTSNVETVEATPEMIAAAAALVDVEYESLRSNFYFNVQETIQINEELEYTFDFNIAKAIAARPDGYRGVGGTVDFERRQLRVFLDSRGYTPEEDGTYRNVKAKDILRLKDTKLWKSGEFFGAGTGESILDEAFVPREGQPNLEPSVFLQGLAERRINNSTQASALNKAFLTNIDPGSDKLNPGANIITFGKEAVKGFANQLPASYAERLIQELPYTEREMLDFSRELLIDSGIEITAKQEDNFKRTMATKVSENLGAFMPMLVNFNYINKATKAIGAAKFIGTLMKGTPRQKVFGLMYGAFLEEVKFEGATFGEAKTLGGTGFFAGGQLANFLLKNRLGGIFQKVIGGAVGGVSGAEAAKVAESFGDALMGDKAFRTSMEEHYGDMDEVTERLIIDGIVFGILGAQNPKAIDFMRRPSKVKRLAEIKAKKEKLLKEGRTEVLKPDAVPVNPDGTPGGKRDVRARPPLKDLKPEVTYDKKTRKEIEKLEEQENALQQDLALGNDAFNRQNIGNQKVQSETAAIEIEKINKVLSNKTGLSFSNFTTKQQLLAERGVYQQIINRYNANRLTAENSLVKEGKRFAKAQGKPDMPIIITENGEGMQPGNKGEFQVNVKEGTETIMINLSEYRKGVMSQEGFHSVFREIFGRNRENVAKKMVEAIETDVSKSLSDVKFESTKFNAEGGKLEAGEVPKSISFKEIIKEIYPEKKTNEEYLGNIIEFLGNKKYRDLLLRDNLIANLGRTINGAADAMGVPFSQKNKLTGAKEIVEFLYRFGENRSQASMDVMFNALKNLSISPNGEKLTDITGEPIKTGREKEKAVKDLQDSDPMGSAKFQESEDGQKIRKAIEGTKEYYKNKFSDLEKVTNEDILIGGLEMGLTLKPWVKLELDKYLSAISLELSDSQKKSIIETITTDFKENSDGINEASYGGQGIVGLTNSFVKKSRLIDFIRKNNPTTAEIDIKAEEYGVKDAGKESAIKIAADPKSEANFMTYVTGAIRNKFKGEITGKEAKSIFSTTSLDAFSKEIEDLSTDDGIGGGNTSDSYEFPEIITKSKAKTINARSVLEVSPELATTIKEVGRKLLLNNRLENLEAESSGKIEMPDGTYVDYVLNTQKTATVTYPDGTVKNVSKFRGTGQLVKKLKGVGKVIKSASTADKLKTDAITLIYNQMIEEAGTLKDNYTPSEQYTAFVGRAFDLWQNNYISLSQANKRFNLFTEPATAKDGSIIKKKSLAGGVQRKKRKIAPAEWTKYFLGDGVTRIDGRRRSLAEVLSAEFGYDAIAENLASEALVEQVASRQKDIGVKLTENFVDLIAKEIDRGIEDNSTMASAAIKAIEKAGGQPSDVFFDSNGKLRTLAEISMRKGGVEAISAIDKELLKVLNAQLNRGPDPVNESTYEKVAKYVLENPNSGITADMLDGIKDLKNASPKNLQNYENQLKKILGFIPKSMGEFTFDVVDSAVPNTLLSGLAGNNSIVNKATGVKYNRETFTAKFGQFLGKNKFEAGSDIEKAWDLVDYLAEINNINGKILFEKTQVLPEGVEFSRTAAKRELADRIEIENKYNEKIKALDAARPRTKIKYEKNKKARDKAVADKQKALSAFEAKYARKPVYVDGKIVTVPETTAAGITMLLHVKNHNVAMNEINSRDITTKRKRELIDALPSREAAKTALQLQEAVLNAMLLSFGEAKSSITKDVLGRTVEQQQQDMFKALASMLINNYKGFRDLSPEMLIELAEGGIWKVKPEHIQSKAEFAANVLIAFNEGKLGDIDQVRETTSKYYSLVGERAIQNAADSYLGITVENAPQAKMLEYVKGQINRVATVADLQRLKDMYNWVEGKSEYEIMVEAQVRKATNQPLRAPKQAITDNNAMLQETGFMLDITNESSTNQSKRMKTVDKAFENGRDPFKEPVGISVFDFDDTLAKTKSNVLYTLPNGTKGKLNATEFAKKSEALEAKGAKFDFSEFSKVVKGELGPLFAEAKKKEGKYTNKDIFVLTARPANSALAIHEFLKSEGLEIPMENIVGLGNGAAKAKSEWMVGKVAEGYNDFYFADDAIKNVEAVRNALDLFDVKSDVQLAIMASKKLSLEKSLAGMIERKKGIPANKKLSAAVASNMGRKKGRYDWFIPAAAEDFAGMMYKFYGKGKQGNEDMALIKETLIRPFNRAENAISTYKQRLGADYEALEKQLGQMDLVISKETKAKLEKSSMNADQAARVFIYNKLGYDIPGLKSGEISNLVRIVNGDARLKAFAEGVMGITKTDRVFPRPGETWFSSNTRYELYKYATEGVRGEFLKEWETNVDKMFTEENYARIEAGYGKDYVKNLKEMLSRMKTGKTRSSDLGKDVQAGMDYVNGSVGVIMFLNTRSAVLQTISAVNYVNWSDNNPLEIGKAVAKPKEWGKTFLEIYNSDFLKQRRGGLEINVEEAEIAKAVERSKGKARALYDGLIKIGFKPTQMADSFAIAFGGTPFLMNRTKTYVKQGLTLEAAKKRAFEDFREVSEESQQSSRQDRVSNIQTGIAGRLIFAFANTPMQMTRMTKKATLDLAYGRGDAKTNISKILYYGAVQSYIFYALQQSQFLRLFGGDDEDMTQEEKDFNKANNEKKNTKIANSMFDSFISGSGSPGKVAITAKNTILRYYKEKAKGYKADYGDVLNEAFSISPPLSSKSKKIYSAYKSYKHFSTKKGQKELAEYGQYAFDNPMLMANAKVFSSLSNVPADRLLQKVNNLYSAFTDETLTPIQSAALAAGWDKWSLGLYDPKFMSEEEVATNKAARKEQLKQEKIAKKEAAISSYDMKMSEPERREILKVLSKKQQMDSLGALEVSIKRRRELYKMKEIDRIEEIIRLQNKRQFYIETRNLNQTRQDSLK